MSDPINWGVVATVVVPIVVAGLSVLAGIASKRTQKGSRENAIIDQLQEQMRLDGERSDKQDARMARIEAKVSLLERVSRVRLEYIYLLRRHIDAGQPPPAPEWPDGAND